MAASADAKAIYADGKSCEEALEDLRTAIECWVFDKQGGIYRGTSNEENQNGYFHDLETDCEKDVYLQIILAPFMEKYLNYPSSEICASSIAKILLRWAYNQDWLEC
jgi:hypothetical protein